MWNRQLAVESTGETVGHVGTFQGNLVKAWIPRIQVGWYSTYSDWGIKWKHEFTNWQSLTYLSDSGIFESTLFSCQGLVISVRFYCM